MISLSTRAKEAIKTGLAMTIAYAIALYMDWPNPHWAGFAVAMISLSTAGQSLNKGVMRMLGTLVAAAAALIFLGLFAQERWLMMLFLSLYVGVCTYMLTGKKWQYAWMVSGFVCLIIVVDFGSTSESAFQAAVERTQETGMGILVYMLVSFLIWPQSSEGMLEDASRKLFATQIQLYRAYLGLMAGKGSGEESRPLRMQEVQLLSQTGQALNAAETDSYEVWETRHQWRRFHQQSAAVMEALEHWRESFDEIQPLDLAKLLTNLEAVCAEVELRFEQIERMLGGNAPDQTPQTISLKINKPEVRALSHFQKAAVVVTKAQLDKLEVLSRTLFDCVADIKGYHTQASISIREEHPRRGLFLDPDRFIAVIRVLATLWISFLIWVYIDPPGHVMFVQLAATIAMAGVMMPHVPILIMLLTFTLGAAFAGVVYIFVMPHLSGYWELGMLIFFITFAIYYLFAKPRQALAKMGAIVPFVVLISVQNEQTYSFAKYANTTAMIMLGIALVVATSYIPTSPRPEKVFLRLLKRFFRHSEYLLSHLAGHWRQERGLVERWRIDHYSDDLLRLSQELALWGKSIDYRTFPENRPAEVQALVTSLHALAFRIKALMDAREHPQAQLLVEHLQEDIRAWREVGGRVFQRLAENPAAETDSDMRERLERRLGKLEARTSETFALAGEGELSTEDYENFYRLLGSYRGLSEAVIGYARLANKINWAQWQEARF